MTTQKSQNTSKVQASGLRRDELQIWVIDLDRPAGEEYAWLDPYERKKSDGFQSQQDRNRYIRSRIALRSILGQTLKVPAAALKFDKGEHGKPYIAYPETTLEFNLTHCEGVGLLAVCNSQVGIDLEFIRPRNSMLKIARRMFPEQMVLKLQDLPAAELPEAFYRQWTEYEAVSKCQGFGIFTPDRTEAGIISHHLTPMAGWIACIAVMSDQEKELEIKQF